MSVRYRPVQWNGFKFLYDLVLALAVLGFVVLYIRWSPDLTGHDLQPDRAVQRMRALGFCAFTLLTVILAIGPLARIDRRFLPLLYNRRHLGVVLFAIAAAHAGHVLGWYHAFSPIDPWVSVLSTNVAYNSAAGFPFEIFGVFAIVILFVMAATSHDFWLAFLGPGLWKALHMGVYLAYGLVFAHVAFGLLQSERNPLYLVYFAACVVIVAGLHLYAGTRERQADRETGRPNDGWIDAGRWDTLAEGRGRVVPTPDGERIAVFRHEGRFSAMSNLCAHQNGPLGEGRVIDGCVTCPWHGFQYRVADGRSPPPFTERVPTYRLKIQDGRLWVDPEALPAGTYIEPVAPDRAEAVAPAGATP